MYVCNPSAGHHATETFYEIYVLWQNGASFRDQVVSLLSIYYISVMIGSILNAFLPFFKTLSANKYCASKRALLLRFFSNLFQFISINSMLFYVFRYIVAAIWNG
jgi:hypothetical protein